MSKNKKFIRPQSANPNRDLILGKNKKLIKDNKGFKDYTKDFQLDIKNTLAYYKGQLKSREGNNEFFDKLNVDTLFCGEKEEEKIEQDSSEEEDDDEEDKENSQDQELMEIKRKVVSFTRPLSQKSMRIKPNYQGRQGK